MVTATVINEFNAMHGAFLASFISGYLLLRCFGRKKLTGVEYLLGAWQAVDLCAHLLFHGYHVLATSVPPRGNSTVNAEWVASPLLRSLEKAWQDYGSADSRFHDPELRPYFLMFTLASFTTFSLLNIMSYIGLLVGARRGHAIHLALCTAEMALLYSLAMPEILMKLKHVNDIFLFSLFYIPHFTIAAIGALYSSYKLCHLSQRIVAVKKNQ